MRVNGKVVIVTGGAQGLGAAITKRLGEEGALVYVGDVKKPASPVERFLELDVTSEADWRALVAEVDARSGRIDVLVNNAGINIREPIEEMSGENLDKMLAVNVRGPFLGMKHCMPVMRRGGGGLFINMSSICGLVGHKYTTEAYTTTKGALTLLTKAVASRYGKDGIRANSIHPSTVDTPLMQELFKDPAKKAERQGEVPLGRLATAEDVANAVLFLVSDEASFLNGVALPVDGGLTAY